MSERRDAPAAGVLRGLGILGWDALEPVIVAALATEAPLLLVGPHGTAKSLLLERLAAALELRFRHYNASILNFDDLVGFPVPDGDRVRYLRTPLDAWDAEAVFIDEISRCRPDLQNRLFPLVHERRLQGERLASLRFRWAAMNPPADPEAPLDEAEYAGSEPLDTALADRFPWVIDVPVRLREEDRLAVIRGGAEGVADANALREAVTVTRARLALADAAHGDGVASYVSAAAHALGRAGVELSTRRTRMVFEGIVGLIATGRFESPVEAALVGLTWSLPQRARGPVAGDAILAAHAAARELLGAPDHRDVRLRLLAESDPVERVVLALDHGDTELLSSTVLDTHAALDPELRLPFAAWLFPLLAGVRPPLHGILFETLAADARLVLDNRESTQFVGSADPRRRLADQVARLCASLQEGESWIEDVLWVALRQDVLRAPHEVVAFARRLSGRAPTAVAESQGAVA